MSTVSKARVRALVAAAAAAVSAATALAPAAAGSSATPWLWRSCAHVHTKYPHGVGKRHAHDRTSSSRVPPVTNFHRSTRLYSLAMHYNRGLDPDRDGIVCEKP